MEQKLRRTFLMVVVAAFFLGLALAGGALLATGSQDDLPKDTPVNTAGALLPTLPPGFGPNTIADMVELAGPAVVKVDTITEVRTGRNLDPFFSDPFFRQFFGDSMPFNQGPQERRGMGSGFVISEDGYILTNQHVVNGAKEIRITLANGQETLQARVVGYDYDMDLALLKVEASGLPFLKLGDSDQVRVGEWVIAIGNPYGLDHTVTVGVISAKGRQVTVDDRRFNNFLQTDASINPGNSGGPLLNLRGEVIGINTAINAQAQGIGFAIPSNTVRGILAELKEKGRVIRPWMGVSLQPLDKELAEYFGVPDTKGAIIAEVMQGSPAARAGLRRGDIIREIDGQEITTPDDVVKIVQSSKIGQRLAMVVHRNKKAQYITVTIQEKGQVR